MTVRTVVGYDAGLFALQFRFEEFFEGFCVGGEFSDSVGEFFDGHLVFVEVEPGD